MLKEIVFHKKEEVTQRKKEFSLKKIQESLKNPPILRNFFMAMKDPSPQVKLLAEYKKGSPSRGLFAYDTGVPDPVQTALLYENAGASAVSVLTEELFFAGDPSHLQDIKKSVCIPVLRKDFIIDEYQLYESRYMGADAVLLIVSLLPGSALKEFIALAGELGMAVVVEAGQKEEVIRAVESGAEVVAINNRDLRNMKIDLNRTLEWGGLVPAERILLSASGIHGPEQLEMLVEKAGVDVVLVGETLMKSPDPHEKIKELMRKYVSSAY